MTNRALASIGKELAEATFALVLWAHFKAVAEFAPRVVLSLVNLFGVGLAGNPFPLCASLRSDSQSERTEDRLRSRRGWICITRSPRKSGGRLQSGVQDATNRQGTQDGHICRRHLLHLATIKNFAATVPMRSQSFWSTGHPASRRTVRYSRLS